MPRNPAELVQQLAHHWMPIYDNITSIPLWISDTFCRATTGDGFSKRELYTDDEDGDRFDEEWEEDRDQIVQELIDVIVTAVEPETWAVNGGAGAIREFNGFLIVRNTPYVHQQLAGPLRENEMRR